MGFGIAKNCDHLSLFLGTSNMYISLDSPSRRDSMFLMIQNYLKQKFMKIILSKLCQLQTQ